MLLGLDPVIAGDLPPPDPEPEATDAPQEKGADDDAAKGSTSA
jgi:hypothetical protein